MRILFWGTPEFAVPSLRALQEEGHAVLAVVTQPDRPAGRGRQLRESPVKREAEREGIPVLQPEKPRGGEFLQEIGALEPDLSVVAAYGHILTDEVLAVARLGSINVHASLLPALRGAAPVNWAIIRGHSHSGVTIMRMVRDLDAGPILYRVATPLSDDISAGELYLMLSGRPPFRTGDEVLLTVQHLRQQPPALHILVPDLPEPLVQIVEKALAKEPAAQQLDLVRGDTERLLKRLGRRPFRKSRTVGIPCLDKIGKIILHRF
ncbi:MAG: formyltransferase family protein [Gemmatimonadota bacterium]